MAINFLLTTIKPLFSIIDEEEESNDYPVLDSGFNEFSFFGKPTYLEENPLLFARETLGYNNLWDQLNYAPENEGNEEDINEDSEETSNEPISKPSDNYYNTSYSASNNKVSSAHTFSFTNAKDYYKSDWDKFNKAFDAVIKQDPSAAKYRNLLSEIAYLESKFIPYIPNGVGALGYFLFMPSTRLDLKRMSGINFTDALLKNNPELQIKLGIILAKYFENGLQNDKEAMRNKGITMSGAIAGAWFSGLGSKKKRNGVRGYIYYGNNPSDGNMRLNTYINRINNVPLEGYPSYTSTNTSTTSMSTQSVTAPSMPKPTGTLPNMVTVASGTVVQNAMSGADTLPTFNLTKCFNTMYYNTNYNMRASRHDKKTWSKKNRTSSGHNCARAVSLGMDAGGLDTDYGKLTATGRPGYAGLYMSWLPKAGFYMLPDDTTDFLPGDVCVTRGRGSRSKSDGKPMGHISMFDGKDWISDYFLRSYASDNWRVWRTAKRGGIDPAGGETHFFRYKGKITY